MTPIQPIVLYGSEKGGRNKTAVFVGKILRIYGIEDTSQWRTDELVLKTRHYCRNYKKYINVGQPCLEERGVINQDGFIKEINIFHILI